MPATDLLIACALVVSAFAAYWMGRLDESLRHLHTPPAASDLPPARSRLLTMPEDWEWWAGTDHSANGPGSGSL